MAAAAIAKTILDGSGNPMSLQFWDSTIGDGSGLLHSSPLLMQSAGVLVGPSNGLYVQLVAGTAVIGTTLKPFVTATASITRPADVIAYTANDAWANSTTAPTAGGFTLANMARTSGGSGVITDIFVLSSAVPGTLLQGEIHLFDSAVTAINDNATWALNDTDALLRIAVIPFTLEADASNSYKHLQSLNIGYTCVGTANLRYLIKVKNAYTPESGEVLTIRVKAEQKN